MTPAALRPRWWAGHLALVAALVAFGWLGWWQLSSFEGSRARSQPVGAEATDIDRATAPGGRLGAADVGLRVRAEGTWEADGQLLVPHRERAGRVGSLVVTPLRTARGVLAVVRGWSPSTGDPAAPTSGTVTVTGVLQRSETEADATAVAGTLPRGQLPYLATVTLLDALPYSADELYDGFVVLREQRPPDSGLLRVTPEEHTAPSGEVGRWRNLAYGLQWWLFGGAAVAFWVAVLRRAAREQAPPPPDDGAPRPPLVAPRRTT